MTPKQKQLLLVDLCARMPFEPMCEYTDIEDGCQATAKLGYSLRDFVTGKVIIKPYLRPMSSMTEKEKEEYDDLLMSVNDGCENTDYLPYNCMKYVDWLNAHHFDYRGLIEKGLALETHEGMYN